jgi:MinD superfamily P-loop ATPase
VTAGLRARETVEVVVLLSVWSPKGGVGTTLSTVVLASVLARTRDVRLVDLGGDVPAMCGATVDAAFGAVDWLHAGPTAPPDALDAVTHDIGERFRVVPRGGPLDAVVDAPDAGATVAAALAADRCVNVVDVGAASGAVRSTFIGAAAHAIVVVRPCYLALHRCATHYDAVQASAGAIVVREHGRALDARDVANVLDRPVLADLPCTPDIARAADAGVLLWRAPHALFGAVAALCERLGLTQPAEGRT